MLPRKARRLAVPQEVRDARGLDIRERIKSIFDCEELPDSPAQLCLIALAHWFDIRCYQSGGPLGQWFIWVDPLAEARADRGRDGRVTVEEWRREYVHLLAEMGYRDDEREAYE